MTSPYTKKFSLPFRIITAFTLIAFCYTSVLFPSAAQAQSILSLPAPGTMISLSPAFEPVLLAGINIYPENPLKIDFIVNKGNTSLNEQAFQEESNKLVKYFLAALTVPEKEMWVNLSPHEKNRIIPKEFGKTEMGRDLLAQDYLLKQLASSLLYPKDELGKKFWDRVYSQAQEKFGTTDIPMDTVNKVWIVPAEATVYEHSSGAFIVQSHLKVLHEEDYITLDANKNNPQNGVGATASETPTRASDITSQVIREIILPEIEREVNEGTTFANLRQIYNAVILATWYKTALKQSLLGQSYVDKDKTSGIASDDPAAINKIYEQYLSALKKGAVNLIEEEYNPTTQEIIPRKYFSGGATAEGIADIVDKATLGKGNLGTTSALEEQKKITLSQDARSKVSTAAKKIIGATLITVSLNLIGGDLVSAYAKNYGDDFLNPMYYSHPMNVYNPFNPLFRLNPNNIYRKRNNNQIKQKRYAPKWINQPSQDMLNEKTAIKQKINTISYLSDFSTYIPTEARNRAYQFIIATIKDTTQDDATRLKAIEIFGDSMFQHTKPEEVKNQARQFIAKIITDPTKNYTDKLTAAWILTNPEFQYGQSERVYDQTRQFIAAFVRDTTKSDTDRLIAIQILDDPFFHPRIPAEFEIYAKKFITEIITNSKKPDIVRLTAIQMINDLSFSNEMSANLKLAEQSRTFVRTIFENTAKSDFLRLTATHILAYPFFQKFFFSPFSNTNDIYDNAKKFVQAIIKDTKKGYPLRLMAAQMLSHQDFRNFMSREILETAGKLVLDAITLPAIKDGSIADNNTPQDLIQALAENQIRTDHQQKIITDALNAAFNSGALDGKAELLEKYAKSTDDIELQIKIINRLIATTPDPQIMMDTLIRLASASADDKKFAPMSTYVQNEIFPGQNDQGKEQIIVEQKGRFDDLLHDLPWMFGIIGAASIIISIAISRGYINRSPLIILLSLSIFHSMATNTNPTIRNAYQKLYAAAIEQNIDPLTISPSTLSEKQQFDVLQKILREANGISETKKLEHTTDASMLVLKDEIKTILGSSLLGPEFTVDELRAQLSSAPEIASVEIALQELGLSKNGEKWNNPLGGIDLNPAIGTLNVQQDGKGVTMPKMETIDPNIDINGITPTIINIVPISNLPLMLGLAEEGVELFS